MHDEVVTAMARNGDGPREHGYVHASAPSFDEFYRTRRDEIVRTLAVSVSSVDLAEEAVDEALARAWRRWGDLDDPGAWTYRVARNWATSWWRRRRRVADERPPDVAADEPTRGQPDPQLAAALDALPEDHRAVLALRIGAERSVAETARALEVPEGTVKSRTARALEALRDSMEVAR